MFVDKAVLFGLAGLALSVAMPTMASAGNLQPVSDVCAPAVAQVQAQATPAAPMSATSNGAAQATGAERAKFYKEAEEQAAMARARIEKGEDLRTKVEEESAAEDAADPDRGMLFDVKFTSIDGTEIDTSQLRGKVILLDFWASWCHGCVMELPKVRDVYEDYKDQGFVVIGISLDTMKEMLAETCMAVGVTWIQYFDGKGWKNKVMADFNSKAQQKLTGIPAALLFDQQGRLVTKNARGEWLRKEVKRLLNIT